MKQKSSEEIIISLLLNFQHVVIKVGLLGCSVNIHWYILLNSTEWCPRKAVIYCKCRSTKKSFETLQNDVQGRQSYILSAAV